MPRKRIDLRKQVAHLKKGAVSQCNLYLQTDRRNKVLRETIEHIKTNSVHWNNETLVKVCVDALDHEMEV